MNLTLGQELLYWENETKNLPQPLLAKVIFYKAAVAAVAPVAGVAAVPATDTTPAIPAVPAVEEVKAQPERYVLLVFDHEGGLHVRHEIPQVADNAAPPAEGAYITPLNYVAPSK